MTRLYRVCLSILLVIVLVLPSVIIQAAENKETNAYTVKELDLIGTKLTEKNNYVPTNITFDLFNVTETYLELEGNVEVTGEQTPFHIEGKLFKSEKSNKRLVGGDLVDRLGNFEVVHFALDQDPMTSFYINKKVNNVNGTYVKLYLMKKDSRDFVFMESQAPPIFLTSNSPYADTIDASNLNKASDEYEYWYGRILQPYKKKLTDDGFSTESIETLSRTIEYQYTYNVLGIDVTEYFKVKHSISARIDNQSRWYVKLEVLDERTDSEEESLRSADTFFKIGYYADSYIRAYTDPGDAFDSVEWASGGIDTGGLSLELLWDKNGKTFGRDNFTETYEYDAYLQRGNFYIFTNDDELTRQVQIKYDKGDIVLEDPGHFLDATFMVGNYHSPGYKYANIRFIYDISNQNDYMYGGLQTVDLYLRYYSIDSLN